MMWKFLLCIAVLQISQTFAVRNNGYFRAFRRGYYPGKPDYQDYPAESRSYDSYNNHRGHGYGYPAYPAVYLLGGSPMGHYGYPVFPYHRYGEQDESIYDYKLEMQPKEEPMTIEKLHTDQRPIKEDNDVMKMKKTVAEMKKKEKMRKMKEMQRQKEQMKKMEDQRRKMMEKETVHAPKYVPMGMPKMVTMKDVEKTNYVRPTARTRVPPSKKESEAMKESNSAGLVFNGKYPGSCTDDGLYYRDETSYVICTNTQAIVQPCAPGTQNQDMMTFTPGSQVSRFDFCTINLVAMGSYSSQGMMGAGDKDDKNDYMNERVKNYFDQHYNSYS